MKRRRLTAVRLGDLPLKTRCEAAKLLEREGCAPGEAAEIMAAAIHPSSRVYFVPQPADRKAA